MMLIALACALTLVVVELRVRNYAVHADPAIERRMTILAPMRLVWSIPALRWLLLAVLPLLTGVEPAHVVRGILE